MEVLRNQDFKKEICDLEDFESQVTYNRNESLKKNGVILGNCIKMQSRTRQYYSRQKKNTEHRIGGDV